MALYYGFAGFGGGYSVLAQIRRDLVDTRRVVSADDFLVFAELSKSLPGTAATNLLALLGQRIGGTGLGLLAAGAFLLPSAALMVACGAAYALVRSSTLLSVFFDGMNAAMVGVVGAVTVDLARSALRSKIDIGIAAACTLLLALHVVTEPVLAVAAVVLGALRGALRVRREQRTGPTPPPRDDRHGAFAFLLGAGGLARALAATGGLGAVFLPIGVMTFGGGLAMIPIIERAVVQERGWLDPKGFADAIALGQITPGPIAICATFIGYRVAGLLGSVVATVAMFGPATALALAIGSSVESFRSSPYVEGALRLLAPAVIAMLAAATISLGRAAVAVHVDIGLAIVSFVVLVWRPVPPLWFLLGGGVVRLALRSVARL